MTVLFRPFCGILMQEKYLPLQYTPLELVSKATDPIAMSGSKNYDESDDFPAASVSECCT